MYLYTCDMHLKKRYYRERYIVAEQTMMRTVMPVEVEKSVMLLAKENIEVNAYAGNESLCGDAKKQSLDLFPTFVRGFS